MSILLESLNQSKDPADQNSDPDVPGINDSHFDDEMLSDEWILKKLAFWKIMSAILLVTLVASWIGFYIYSEQPSELKEKSIANENVPDSTEIIQTVVPKAEPKSSIQEKQSVETQDATKPVYQPKKITKSLVNDENETKENTQKKSAIVLSSSEQVDNEAQNNDQPIEFESLSEAALSEMPELEISSYAVSSNPKKSFVVLNGGFYGIGETIAPNLVLLEINKDGIIIRYRNQLIKKKYSL